MTFEELKEQYELQVLRSMAYKDDLVQTLDRLAESRSLLTRERQKRQNLEQENEQLKKELKEERIGNSQAEEPPLHEQIEVNKEYHRKRAEAAG
ncbi:hypothetical protein P9D51_22825 [Bacillus sonorensis]|uniref:hypothetical protein n=1 Tax=Bacillus sonorensis TaxID=119858 RepID=UPI002DBA3256|nr:hypothetical protein [Bacillus sonorensis]MEC1428879.1 hypothetical protein [Bacillus sonorensis]